MICHLPTYGWLSRHGGGKIKVANYIAIKTFELWELISIYVLISTLTSLLVIPSTWGCNKDTSH
jgi:hypothetical protein